MCVCVCVCVYVPSSSPELTPRIVNDVEFHPDGNCIAVATNDNVVKVRTYVRTQICPHSPMLELSVRNVHIQHSPYMYGSLHCPLMDV